jgi:hypothetical protein
MADSEAYTAREINFRYTRQDDKPIVFNKKDAAGDPIDNSGYTYKMEGHSQPDPDDESGQLFALIGTAGGANGKITFEPAGGAGGDFDPASAESIFFDVVETDTTPDSWTIIRGEVTLDERITDKGV